jgi:hypothetical protein
VAHVVVGRVATQKVAPPDTNVTVPVAAPGSPTAARVSLVPNATLDGVAVAANAVDARTTVKDVDAVDPQSPPSPEYVAVIG